MSDDPRVMAVAVALADPSSDLPDMLRASLLGLSMVPLAEVAVAALDAFDEGHRPEASDISAASWANLLRILDAREVRRREIIASEIDHARDERDAALSANDAGRYEDGFVDGLDHAASIARGRS